MFGRLGTYRLRAKLYRQGHMLKMRRYLLNKRNEIVREKVKIMTTGIVFAGLYFYGRSLAEYHLKVKKLRKKFFQLYPELTKIVLFSQLDPYITKNLDYQIDKIQIPESQEATQIKERLGDAIIIFSPINFDQFCRALELCHQFKFKVLIGNYQIQDNIHNLSQFQQIPTPNQNSRYLVIDISNFNKVRIDDINNIVHADTGCKISHFNSALSCEGYEPLFEGYFDKMNLYQIIQNNLPLKNGKKLDSSVLNFSLISGEGKRFKSSTSLPDYGQIINLTSLFIGSGSMAIPAEVRFQINPKTQQEKHYYEIDGLQLQKIKSNGFKVFSREGKNILQSPLCQNLVQTKQTPPQLKDPEIIMSLDQAAFTKFLSNSEVQKNLSFIFENNLLFVQFNGKEKAQNFFDYGKKIGGRLIWTKNNRKNQHLKKQREMSEVNPALQKKLGQLRKCLDRKKMLIEHDRNRRKGFFERILSIFVE